MNAGCLSLGDTLVIIDIYLATALDFGITCLEDLLGSRLVRVVLDEGLLLRGFRKFVIDEFLEELEKEQERWE